MFFIKITEKNGVCNMYPLDNSENLTGVECSVEIKVEPDIDPSAGTSKINECTERLSSTVV